jgi:transposase
MKTAIDQVEISPVELASLAQYDSPQALSDEQWKIVQSSLLTMVALREAYSRKDRAYQKFSRIIFGPKSERSRDVFGKEKDQDEPADEGDETFSDKNDSAKQDGDKGKKKPKGHGRNGVDAFPGLNRIFVPHPDLHTGKGCSLCQRGKLYPLNNKCIIRLKGQAPVAGCIYELERLRCNACGEVFIAPAPCEAGKEKYDATVGAMIANLKYGAGMPWYRLEKLQKNLGIPLAASTQWDITEKTADQIHPVFPALVRHGAQGDIIENDDSPMKIISLIKENREENPKRKGMFTTGIVSIKGDIKIALFFTGRRHAGENLEKVLEKRDPGRGPPIQVADGSASNAPKGHATIRGSCNDHGRRKFVEASSNYPEQCLYVIESLGQVYKNDEITKKENMDPVERWRFHLRHSAQVMAELRLWLLEQIEDNKEEANSGLGSAISYMLKQWTRLTLFLWWPGVPLSSCLVEQALKVLVLGRKNFYLYRTEHGAFIGDMFMSIIHTCNLNGINPFDYITALQRHSSDVFKNPDNWLPWNYLKQIDELEKVSKAVEEHHCPTE